MSANDQRAARCHNPRECWCGIDHELERRIADHGTNAPFSAYAWRVSAIPGGRYCTAALTPEEAGQMVATAIRDHNSWDVMVERFALKSDKDANDAFGDVRRKEQADAS